MFDRRLKRLSGVSIAITVIMLWVSYGEIFVSAHNFDSTPPYVYSAFSWETLSPGFEYGRYFPPNSDGAQLLVTRIDPTLFNIEAHYHPGDPHYRVEWAKELTCARLFVNANFYDQSNQIVGLLIQNGEHFGTSFDRFGGQLEVDFNGVTRVRSLTAQPDTEHDLIWQAVQGFPMLIHSGAPVINQADNDEQARRTAAALDQSGNILLIISPGLGIRLTALIDTLMRTDLEIVEAVNLDGGTSTLMQIADIPAFTVDSVFPVPAVLTVSPRVEVQVCTIKGLPCGCRTPIGSPNLIRVPSNP